jgi:ubiquinone/menaquinone biosynthesis C-methylase UbiE
MTGIDRFDQWSATYDRAPLRPLHDRAHEGVLALASEWRLQPRRILDIGCGTGRLLATLAVHNQSAALVGVDLSSGMLAAARLNPGCARIAFCRAAAEHLPFADAAFDLVTATVSFRHWHDQAAGVREAARVMAPGAALVIAGPFGPARPSRLLPERGLPPALSRAALHHCGLSLQTVRHLSGFGPIPHITLLAATRR